MPDLEWNKETWERSYEWTAGGDEWSGPWGSSKAEWFATILPRIGSLVPADSILEIAPGFGRWTQFLLQCTNYYCGVDLSDKCVSACQKRFSACRKAHFFLNDGLSLQCVAARQYDLVFSFDSLVHADFDVMAAYVQQIIPMLRTDGVAFIHHSNLAAFPGKSSAERSETVSGDIVTELVQSAGGRVLVQELVAWEGDILSDCYTMFCRKDSFTSFAPVFLSDPNSLDLETTSARETFQHYLRTKP